MEKIENLEIEIDKRGYIIINFGKIVYQFEIIKENNGIILRISNKNSNIV